MAKNAPIGIFDSGVGGLTVAKQIANLLPKEHFVYFGDTAHLPYGDKSNEAICRYSLRIAEFLIEKKAKALVIACNTASAVALPTLQKIYGSQLPIFNVIDPVVEATVARGHKNVGVIGTRATVNSHAYAHRLQQLNPEIKVACLATPLLVPIIEEGLSKTSISKDVIAFYLKKDVLQNISALLLGCTHYPILLPQIEAYLGQKAEVLDSPMIVAEMISQVLSSKGLLARKKEKEHQFFVSDYTETFNTIAHQFFGDEILLNEHKI